MWPTHLLVAAGLLLMQCSIPAHCAPAAISGPIDDLIVDLLEQFRDSLTEPQPIEDIAIDLNDPGIITMRVNITDALLYDLSTFVIDNVSVDVLTLKVDVALSLPTLSLECNYAFGSGSTVADLFPFYGAGPASVGLGGLVLTVNADFKHNFTDGQDHYQIEAMDFYFHFDTLDVEMHNLFNNEDLATVIDGFADDFGPVLVDVLVNETRKDLMPAIIVKLNEILWNATVSLPNSSNHVSISEPLKPIPAMVPMHRGLVGARRASLQQAAPNKGHLQLDSVPSYVEKSRQASKSRN